MPPTSRLPAPLGRRAPPHEYFIVGTWNDFSPAKMDWDGGSGFTFDVTVGDEGWESFQILRGADWGSTVYPSVKDGNPYQRHELRGPDDKGHGLNWSIGRGGDEAQNVAKAGEHFQITLIVDSDFVCQEVTWDRLIETQIAAECDGVLPAPLRARGQHRAEADSAARDGRGADGRAQTATEDCASAAALPTTLRAQGQHRSEADPAARDGRGAHGRAQLATEESADAPTAAASSAAPERPGDGPGAPSTNGAGRRTEATPAPAPAPEHEAKVEVFDGGKVATQRANFLIVRSQLEEEVLSMALERAGMTPHDIVSIWENDWGVRLASSIKFEAPPGSDTRWLSHREDAVPVHPAVTKLHCRGRGSVLTALAVAFRQHSENSEVTRRGSFWEQAEWSVREVHQESARRRREGKRDEIVAVAERCRQEKLESYRRNLQEMEQQRLEEERRKQRDDRRHKEDEEHMEVRRRNEEERRREEERRAEERERGLEERHREPERGVGARAEEAAAEALYRKKAEEARIKREEKEERERWLEEKARKGAERRKELEAKREQARRQAREGGARKHVSVGTGLINGFKDTVRESFPGDGGDLGGREGPQNGLAKAQLPRWDAPQDLGGDAFAKSRDELDSYLDGLDLGGGD